MTTLFSTFIHSEEALTSLRLLQGGAGGRGAVVKNLGNGWSKSIVLEDKVVINFDFGQVIWTTRCKVMAKYISTYFDIFYKKLV